MLIGVGFQQEMCIKWLNELSMVLAVVTLHTFALGKVHLLTVSLGKLSFSSVTDFSLGNLPGGILLLEAWISYKNNRVSLDSYPKARARANSNPKVTNQ